MRAMLQRYDSRRLSEGNQEGSSLLCFKKHRPRKVDPECFINRLVVGSNLNLPLSEILISTNWWSGCFYDVSDTTCLSKFVNIAFRTVCLSAVNTFVSYVWNIEMPSLGWV